MYTMESEIPVCVAAERAIRNSRMHGRRAEDKIYRIEEADAYLITYRLPFSFQLLEELLETFLFVCFRG